MTSHPDQTMVNHNGWPMVKINVCLFFEALVVLAKGGTLLQIFKLFGHNDCSRALAYLSTLNRAFCTLLSELTYPRPTKSQFDLGLRIADFFENRDPVERQLQFNEIYYRSPWTVGKALVLWIAFFELKSRGLEPSLIGALACPDHYTAEREKFQKFFNEQYGLIVAKTEIEFENVDNVHHSRYAIALKQPQIDPHDSFARFVFRLNNDMQHHTPSAPEYFFPRFSGVHASYKVVLWNYPVPPGFGHRVPATRAGLQQPSKCMDHITIRPLLEIINPEAIFTEEQISLCDANGKKTVLIIFDHAQNKPPMCGRIGSLLARLRFSVQDGATVHLLACANETEIISDAVLSMLFGSPYARLHDLEYGNFRKRSDDFPFSMPWDEIQKNKTAVTLQVPNSQPIFTLERFEWNYSYRPAVQLLSQVDLNNRLPGCGDVWPDGGLCAVLENCNYIALLLVNLSFPDQNNLVYIINETTVKLERVDRLFPKYDSNCGTFTNFLYQFCALTGCEWSERKLVPSNTDPSFDQDKDPEFEIAWRFVGDTVERYTEIRRLMAERFNRRFMRAKERMDEEERKNKKQERSRDRSPKRSPNVIDLTGDE